MRNAIEMSPWSGDAALEPGQLGVVMARAGVGKSGLLTHLGVDRGVRGESTLHVALAGSLASMEAAYAAELANQLADVDPVTRAQRQAELARRRLLVALPEPLDCAEPIDRSLRLAREGMGLEPTAILIDGFRWSVDEDAVRRQLKALRDAASGHGAAVWMTARTSRATTGAHPTEMPPACAPFSALIDLALFLEPGADGVEVRILQDRRGGDEATATTSLRGRRARRRRSPALQDPRLVTLVSGGAAGAETTFGACAERWRLSERTLSFAGRSTERRRGLVELTEDELRRGDVSRSWLTARMHRVYDPDRRFQKLLQTLWHQVTDAREVFAVGAIQADDTVRGGTGWAVELARLWGKPVSVFDQPTSGWYQWDGERWVESPEPPVIGTARFCGTGTRHLDDSGREAIEGLFTRSFGTPGKDGGAGPSGEKDHD